MKNTLPAYRERHDLSQADLAEAVGVSRQTINAIERERYDPLRWCRSNCLGDVLDLGQAVRLSLPADHPLYT